MLTTKYSLILDQEYYATGPSHVQTEYKPNTESAPSILHNNNLSP